MYDAKTKGMHRKVYLIPNLDEFFILQLWTTVPQRKIGYRLALLACLDNQIQVKVVTPAAILDGPIEMKRL